MKSVDVEGIRWSKVIIVFVGAVIIYTLLSELIGHIDKRKDNSSEVTILHLNDIYRIGGIDEQRKGGLARVAWLRKNLEQKGKTVIVTHAGDALAPSLLSDLYKGARMIEILNLVAGKKSGVPMLFTIGNHEFDHSACNKTDPKENLNVLQTRIKESNFVWLDGNIDYTKNVKGESCNGWTGGMADKRKAFVNIPVNGINLGFFGLTIAPESDGEKVGMPATIKDNAEAAKEFVRALRQQSDFVIGLTHLDVADDIAILNGPRFSAPDLILGGHDHDYRACVDHDEVSGLKRLYKGTAEALDVIQIDIRKNKNGKVEYAQQRVSLGENAQQDADVQKRINVIMSEHQADFCKDETDPQCLDKPIGTRDTTVKWVLEEFSNRGKETVFGNWLTRLMLKTYKPELPKDFCVGNVGIAALYLSGSLRLNFDLPAGSTVTRRILEETAKYDSIKDPQQAICVTGATVYASIKHGLTKRFDGEWPHYTGLKAEVAKGGKLKLMLLGGPGDIEIGPESTDNIILIVQDYVAVGKSKYPIKKEVISESHVFAGRKLTLKSILIAALSTDDGRPDRRLDWRDGRKAWGTREKRGKCESEESTG